MHRTMKIAMVLGCLALFTFVSYTMGAAASTYVGVKRGDTFQYKKVITGNTTEVGTYDMTYMVDLVTDNNGNATINSHVITENATMNATIIYMNRDILETTTNASDEFMEGLLAGDYFVINKNTANKTINVTFWFFVLVMVNGTYDSNGVLKDLNMYVTNGIDQAWTVITRQGGGIPSYPTFALIAFGAAAAGILVRKKLNRLKKVE
ncbi:MAG: hypothetical protein RBG13Loki_3282 [Promethearchaeota archaeon CR_4]|nr:MAG: hypothetical protein RBG13Loki_3282 [Candidatus Lokiarchaeota archaeon CR_4]